MKSLRQMLGALLLDIPRSWAMLQEPDGWVKLNNRLDTLSMSEDPVGVRCHSPSTSSLHVCDVFPRFGRTVLKNVLQTWSFQLAQELCFSDDPEFSFVIPHRGSVRQPLLELTIRSIAALGGRVECIVVEQDDQPHLTLPPAVRHLHAPHPDGSREWRKCYAFNRGVEIARAPIIICHDGDIVVPVNYLDIIRRHLIDLNQDVVFPQRFLFYLDQATTQTILATEGLSQLSGTIPDVVKQNWTGGTLAIKRDAYHQIGGFDELFTGWTGEDREFYDRCETLNGWFYGYVPFLHLWHPPQLGRVNAEARQAAYDFTTSRMSISRQERILEIRRRQFESVVE